MPATRLIRRHLALGAALALALSGCGRQAPRAPAHPPAPAPTRSHTIVINMPWTLLSARGRTIRLRWIGGGCLTFDRTATTETPQQVAIALLIYRHVPGPGEVCAADAFLAVTVVRLHQPIGARRIVRDRATP